MFVIEVTDTNSQLIEAVLDETLYYIVLNWNETNKNWTMGLRNSGYRMIVDGISIVPNFPLLYQFRYSDMPEGELMVLTANVRNGPIPRLETDSFFNGNYELVYMTRSELEEEELLETFGRL